MIKEITKRLIFLPIIMIAAMTGCEKVEKGVPKCVTSHIKGFSKDACDDGANVQEFPFKVKLYMFSIPGTAVLI